MEQSGGGSGDPLHPGKSFDLGDRVCAGRRGLFAGLHLRDSARRRATGPGDPPGSSGSRICSNRRNQAMMTHAPRRLFLLALFAFQALCAQPLSFRAERDYTVPAGNPSAIALGDFNGDGRPDLAVAASGGIAVMLDAKGGFFQMAQISSVPGNTAIAVGDFNHDGKTDIAAVQTAAGTITVLLGNGNGTFQAGLTTPVAEASPQGLAVGDFNRDGKLDLAVVAGDAVIVFLGKGDGTFNPGVSYPVSPTPVFVAAADFNHDGKTDLVTVNVGATSTTPGTVSVLLGNGNGTFQSAVPYTVGDQPSSVAIADFNGDGKLDLAVANRNTDSISLLLGNGDGKHDLVAVNSSTNSIYVLLGNGDGTFQPPTAFLVDIVPVFVAAGDFNRDGRPDVAVANSSSGDISILFGNGK